MGTLVLLYDCDATDGKFAVRTAISIAERVAAKPPAMAEHRLRSPWAMGGRSQAVPPICLLSPDMSLRYGASSAAD